MASSTLSRTANQEQPLPSEEYVSRAMPRIMGTTGMTSIYLVAIFFIVNAATAASGGPAAFTYLFLGAITFFVPSAIATAQLGVMFPNEGSLYNWTHKALGGFMSFFIGFCAWFPGVLVMIAGADIVMSFLQGINSNWLTQPWQQGLVIIAIIIFSGLISVQSMRTVQLIVNVSIILIFLAVVLVGFSAIVWLVSGHHAAVNFAKLSDWGIQMNPTTGNFNLFGLITLAYLGTEVPLNMGGEIKPNGERRIVTRHIFWGTILVLVGYFITTTALLVVQGPSVGNVGGFSLITNVDMAFGGKLIGNVTIICIVFFFVIVPIVYNNSFARLLLVGGLDHRLPRAVARLNKHRAPAAAIWFQTWVAVLFSVLIFIGIPYIFRIANPADLATNVYNLMQAAATLVWALSTSFLFVDLAIFYRRDPAKFHSKRIFPMPILVISSLVGPIACLVAIVDTFFFSWIPSLIANTQWWYLVGGLTVVCLCIAMIGSIYATGEVGWQILQEEVG